MNMIKCLKKLLIRLHEWVQKKWLIVSVLMSTSSIWFSLILSFWGEKLHFIVTDASGKRQFTFLGAILTILVVGFSCLLAMAQRYYEYSKLNNDKDKRKLVVLENVDIETNKICDNKYITLKKRLWKIKNGQIVDIPQIVSNPCEQLKHILDIMNAFIFSVSVMFLPFSFGTLREIMLLIAFNNLGLIVMNLVPFLPLDGYFILTNILKIPNLRRISGKKIISIIRGEKRKLVEYIIYNIISVLFVSLVSISIVIQIIYNFSLGVNSRGGVLGGIIEIKGYLLIIIIMCISKILSFKGSKNYGKDN